VIVQDAGGAVASWVQRQIPSLVAETGFGPSVAFGVLRRGAPSGGCVFHGYYPASSKMEVTWVGRCTRGEARDLLRYPFGVMGVNLLWAAVLAENWRVIRMAGRLGFQRAAGEQRHYFGPERHAVILSMTRGEWLARHERVN